MKYDLKFTGNLLDDDRQKVLKKTSEFFNGLSAEKASKLITAKARIKKNIDLHSANVLKTKFENLGVECEIYEAKDNDKNLLSIKKTDEKNSDFSTRENSHNRKKESFFILTISLVLILITFLYQIITHTCQYMKTW